MVAPLVADILPHAHTPFFGHIVLGRRQRNVAVHIASNASGIGAHQSPAKHFGKVRNLLIGGIFAVGSHDHPCDVIKIHHWLQRLLEFGKIGLSVYLAVVYFRPWLNNFSVTSSTISWVVSAF